VAGELCIAKHPVMQVREVPSMNQLAEVAASRGGSVPRATARRLVLPPDEARAALEFCQALADRYDGVEDERFLRDCAVLAHSLPERLRVGLCRFRLEEPAGALVVSGLPVDDEALGPTPGSWVTCSRPAATRPHEIYLMLCSSLLGEVFGWRLDRAGQLVHDVAPVAGQEHEQSGASSNVDLLWHTEEAFHPLRGDYVTLLCLRNPDRTPTTVATVNGDDLSAEHLRVLRQARFTILPESAHEAGEAGSAMPVHQRRLYENARRQLDRQSRTPEPVALLYGDPQTPYLRVDPAYMPLPVPGDKLATEAFAALAEVIERNLQPVVLEPGHLAVIDNARAVHGRRPFRPRYDGRDRWLKRCNVTRDLRRSREARLTSSSRVVF